MTIAVLAINLYVMKRRRAAIDRRAATAICKAKHTAQCMGPILRPFHSEEGVNLYADHTASAPNRPSFLAIAGGCWIGADEMPVLC